VKHSHIEDPFNVWRIIQNLTDSYMVLLTLDEEDKIRSRCVLWIPEQNVRDTVPVVILDPNSIRNGSVNFKRRFFGEESIGRSWENGEFFVIGTDEEIQYTITIEISIETLTETGSQNIIEVQSARE